MLWLLLTQFLYRITLGMAVSMFFLSAKQVTSGFFRVHLWVLLGLNTLALLVLVSSPDDFVQGSVLISLAVGTGLVSYLGSAIWLFEWRSAGKIALLFVAALAIASLWVESAASNTGISDRAWMLAHGVTSGLLIGTTMTAMFLGHWYLNTPTMQLNPLKWLVCSLQFSLLARALLCGIGLASLLAELDGANRLTVALLAIRWIGGLIGVELMAWMTWQTLKIPNTQSATGILYVGVILVFLGELSSQLLSAQTGFLV